MKSLVTIRIQSNLTVHGLDFAIKAEHARLVKLGYPRKAAKAAAMQIIRSVIALGD